MPKAVWNGAILAESDQTEVVEGNHYFPPDSISREYFQDSEHHTVCGLEGHGQLLRCGGRWQHQPPSRMVLPRSQTRSREHQRLRGLLERRGSAGLRVNQGDVLRRAEPRQRPGKDSWALF